MATAVTISFTGLRHIPPIEPAKRYPPDKASASTRLASPWYTGIQCGNLCMLSFHGGIEFCRGMFAILAGYIADIQPLTWLRICFLVIIPRVPASASADLEPWATDRKPLRGFFYGPRQPAGTALFQMIILYCLGYGLETA